MSYEKHSSTNISQTSNYQLKKIRHFLWFDFTLLFFMYALVLNHGSRYNALAICLMFKLTPLFML